MSEFPGENGGNGAKSLIDHQKSTFIYYILLCSGVRYSKLFTIY